MTLKDQKGKLYLFPAPLGTEPVSHILPPYHLEILDKMDLFFVENIRTSRRYLKKINPFIDIDSLEFVILDKYTGELFLTPYIQQFKEGRNAAMLSEAGVPCIADPGSKLVMLMQEADLQVVPLPGPSSVLQGLMASGMTGQKFTFHGYLPIPGKERAEALKELERRSASENGTQIFIETPYRNVELFKSILRHCRKDTQLCIACQIMQDNEWIVTRTVEEWQGEQPDIHKKPAVFLLSRYSSSIPS